MHDTHVPIFSSACFCQTSCYTARNHTGLHYTLYSAVLVQQQWLNLLLGFLEQRDSDPSWQNFHAANKSPTHSGIKGRGYLRATLQAHCSKACILASETMAVQECQVRGKHQQVLVLYISTQNSPRSATQCPDLNTIPSLPFTNCSPLYSSSELYSPSSFTCERREEGLARPTRCSLACLASKLYNHPCDCSSKYKWARCKLVNWTFALSSTL